MNVPPDPKERAQAVSPDTEQDTLPIRLVLADDHQLLRQSLRRTLEEQNFKVLGEASNGNEAIQLAEQLRPDVVLMDVSMPALDGIEATRRLHASVPELPVVILTMHDEPALLARALEAGAVGYMVKDCSIDQVSATIRLAASGAITVSPELAAAVLHHAQPEPLAEAVLSKREEEVLQLFAEGCGVTDVASALFISTRTVKNHLGSIYQKLDAHDRTQAVLAAVRMGIIKLS